MRQPGGELVSMGRTDEVREAKVLAAGSYWVWAPPETNPIAWFGTERAVGVHWSRVFVQMAVWGAVVGAAVYLSRAPEARTGGSGTTGPGA